MSTSAPYNDSQKKDIHDDAISSAAFHPMTLSHIALAVGLRGGDFNTLTPSLVIDSSRWLAKILSRS
jgi:hypothetical protein